MVCLLVYLHHRQIAGWSRCSIAGKGDTLAALNNHWRGIDGNDLLASSAILASGDICGVCGVVTAGCAVTRPMIRLGVCAILPAMVGGCVSSRLGWVVIKPF